MNNADIQYQKLIKILHGIDERLIKIEGAMVGRTEAKDAPVNIVIKPLKKVNAASR
jgi:hypothetical protein